jgi:hypothetical protein
MSLRAIPPPLWFVVALFPMVASQIIRLQQSDPASWIFWDYAGRLGALAVLTSIPSARIVAFRWEHLRIARWEAVSWIVGIVLVDTICVVGFGGPLIPRCPQRCSGPTPNCTGGMKLSTMPSACPWLRIARKLYSAAAAIICSGRTWVTGMP